MHSKFLMNMVLILVATTSLSALQAIREEERDTSKQLAARMSSDPNDLLTDAQIAPARASALNGQISGSELAQFIRRIALPITEPFLRELEGVAAGDLADFALSKNINFEGALFYLYLEATGAIPSNQTETVSAFASLTSDTSASSSLRPYYMYFIQDFMMKGLMHYSPEYFAEEQFKDQKSLPQYLRFRSLILQVWGGLKKFSEEFSQGKIQSIEEFVNDEYARGVFILAATFVTNPFDVFPKTYVKALSDEYDNFCGNLRSPEFWPHILQLTDCIQEWITPLPSQLSMKQPLSVAEGKPLVSAFKRTGEESHAKPKKSVRFPEEYDTTPPKRGNVVVTRQASPGNNLFGYFVNLFDHEIPFQTALYGALQQGSEWLVAHEQHSRGTLFHGSEEALDSPTLQKAALYKLINGLRIDLEVMDSPEGKALLKGLLEGDMKDNE